MTRNVINIPILREDGSFNIPISREDGSAPAAGGGKEGEWKNGRCHNDKGNRNVSKDSNNSGSGIIRSGMGRLLRSKPREGRRSRNSTSETLRVSRNHGHGRA